MRPVELVMVGAGNRGYLAYGAFAERNPHEAKFVAVVEPDAARRARFANAHRIPAERQFRSWEDIAGRSRRFRVRANSRLVAACLILLLTCSQTSGDESSRGLEPGVKRPRVRSWFRDWWLQRTHAGIQPPNPAPQNRRSNRDFDAASAGNFHLWLKNFRT